MLILPSMERISAPSPSSVKVRFSESIDSTVIAARYSPSISCARFVDESISDLSVSVSSSLPRKPLIFSLSRLCSICKVCDFNMVIPSLSSTHFPI